jgi:hypothetical protein
MAVNPTKYNDFHGWADCVVWFIRVVKQMNKMHLLPLGAIVGPAHLVPENVAFGGMNIVSLVGKDWSVIIKWVGIWLCVVEPHALEVLCMC